MSARAFRLPDYVQNKVRLAGAEAWLRDLPALVSELERGELGLESSIERYQQGIVLLKECQGLLSRYRKQVEELTADAETALRPYAADPDVGKD